MLSSFGTGAGTIGIMIVVAPMEQGNRRWLWENVKTFATAQQFGSACLVRRGLIAMVMALKGDAAKDSG